MLVCSCVCVLSICPVCVCERMCAHVHVVNAGVYMPGHAYGGEGKISVWLVILHLTLDRSLLFICCECQKAWPTGSQGVIVSTVYLSGRGDRITDTSATCQLLSGFWDLNSSPHTCTANALTHMLFLQPYFYTFWWNHFRLRYYFYLV